MKRIEYKYIVGVVFVFGLFMDLLDMTITNVALPTLKSDFSTSTTTIEWVVTGYLLSLAIFIPVSGWAGDRFGTKRVFMFALTVFTTSSLLCALSWNIQTLIGFRVLQGVGGGMLTPVGTAMLYRAFPPAERATASAVLSIPAAMALCWLVSQAAYGQLTRTWVSVNGSDGNYGPLTVTAASALSIGPTSEASRRKLAILLISTCPARGRMTCFGPR